MTAEPRGLTDTPRGFSGMTALERAIMAEWDAGLSYKRIALKLGCPPRRVEATITNYDGKADHAFACRAAKQGSAQLLAAIARHHPERLRPERVEGIAA